MTEPDADAVVQAAFDAQYNHRGDPVPYFPVEPRSVTRDIRDAAGLEGDGLVVLRYEGDGVTVAGRLAPRPLGRPATTADTADDLYRIVAPPTPRSAQ
jgi:hypothetical protein